jgi:signal transduction histidine kinase
MSDTLGHERTLTDRERELGAIIAAYNQVTEQLKRAHDQLECEVRRLREELEQKNRELARRERLAALGEMAAGMAHEIRNPLGGVQLFAGLLRKDLAEQPGPLALVEKIANGVRSLESIVTDILTFAGEAAPRFAPMCPVQLVDQAVELAQGVAEQHGAAIRWQRPSNGLTEVRVEADADQIQQALLNLLQNGLEAAGAGGRVDVDVAAGRDGYVHITVADTGPGIPTELLDRIFNPFFTTKGRGTGLGLAIVHRIAEGHGGTVRAATSRGGGAVFSLSLPRSQAQRRDTDWEDA